MDNRHGRNMEFGSLKVRSGIIRHDEIGILAREFDAMISTLNGHVKGLDEKVKEKNYELLKTTGNWNTPTDSSWKAFSTPEPSSRQCCPNSKANLSKFQIVLFSGVPRTSLVEIFFGYSATRKKFYLLLLIALDTAFPEPY